MRKKILVLAGGRSDEHHVSLTSARSVVDAIRKSGSDADVIVIQRDGTWLEPHVSHELLLAANPEPAKAQTRAITVQGSRPLPKADLAATYDVVFPVLHGPYGEDGTIQGMLKLADIPFVGSDVLASAVCMDKPMGKDVLAAHGLKQVPYTLIRKHDYETDPGPCLEACLKLPSPWFIKPANLGSSVGISKAKSQEELLSGIAEALAFDRRVIVESGVLNARELEVAVLGNDEPQASVVGEITYGNVEFYDYETKYTDGTAQLLIPADIPQEIANAIRQQACEAFQILDCAGLARVDFFYCPDDNALYLNELNTMPGFTQMSMFPKLWEASGVTYDNLVKKLVDLAIARWQS